MKAPGPASGPAAWGAERIAAAVRGGEVSALEVTEACLVRTRQVEPVVGAFLRLDAAGARRRARAVDRHLRRGRAPGRLAGVPVAIKDNLSLAGQPLTCASRLFDGYVAPFTATAVERLLAAGAVPLGKTNLDELAMGSSCEHSAFQRTRNPWHLERVPGGSSGGSAAAVAAACVPVALGSDTGGSVRQPAALCGVVGLRPTWGRVSRHGLVAFASSLDQVGPLARSVRDAALTLEVIAGADRRDSTASPRPAGGWLAGIEEGLAGAGTRLGVVREVAAAALPDDTRREFEESLRRLEGLGAERVEVSIPAFAAAVAAYQVLAACQASANLARFDGLRYGRRAGSGGGLDEVYAASRSEGFGPEVKRRIMIGTFALSAGYRQAYYGRACGVVETLRRQVEAAFERVDVLATPTAPGGAFGLGERLDDPVAMALSDLFTLPASLLGLPAVAVPSGLDDEGLPLSLQLVAPPWEEGRLLRWARAFEAACGWRAVPAFRQGTVAAAGEEG